MLGTISLDNLISIQSVYFHGSCADGIIAREILKTNASTKIKYIPYYFDELKTIPEKALFIDCSPKPHQVEECLKRGCLIADHHDTFKDSFMKFNDVYPNAMMFGENEKAESGAVLAYRLFKKMKGYVANEELSDVADLIGISDTWHTEHKDFEFSRKLAKYVTFFGNDFSESLQILLDPEGIALINAMGAVFQRESIKHAKSALSFFAGSRQLKVFFINDLNISDAAEILRNDKGADLVVGWKVQTDANPHGNGDPITVFTLRSNDRFDCRTFAQAHGGGGHTRAAGFSMPFDFKSPVSPMSWLMSELEVM